MLKCPPQSIESNIIFSRVPITREHSSNTYVFALIRFGHVVTRITTMNIQNTISLTPTSERWQKIKSIARMLPSKCYDASPRIERRKEKEGSKTKKGEKRRGKSLEKNGKGDLGNREEQPPAKHSTPLPLNAKKERVYARENRNFVSVLPSSSDTSVVARRPRDSVPSRAVMRT